MLERYPFTGCELVYADPPYMLATRGEARPYQDFELSDIGHERLLRLLRRLPCPVVLSGYFTRMYATYLKGWRLVRYRASTRGGPVEECAWCNFQEVAALHDYSFLGDGYRERERIRKKRKRWAAKLRKMPILERQAILAAIADTGISGGAGLLKNEGADLRRRFVSDQP
jgi:hypothetical protein